MQLQLPEGEPARLPDTQGIRPARRRHRHRQPRGSSPDLLLRIVDGGLAASIFLLPLVMGGRQALGALVLSLLALGVALTWLARAIQSRHATWRWSCLEGVFLLALILLVLQILPLPSSALAWLSPHSSQILPLWSTSAPPSAALGQWSTVSLTPSETRDGLITLLSYCLLFVVTIQRIQGLEDVERLLRWCAWSAVLMAGFGMVQYLTSNGKFFWFYQHPYSNTEGVTKGSFTNRNHFADFLALGLGPLLWWIQKLLRQRQLEARTKFQRTGNDSPFAELLLPASILAMGLVVFACLLSLSRGGMAAMLLAVAIAALVCYRASAIGPRFLLSLGAMGLLVAVCLMIFGEDRVAARLSDLQSGSFEEVDHGAGRRTIWKAVVKAIPDFAVLGAGVGSLPDIYPRYLEAPNGPKYYSHAENGPLQVALETGIPGMLLLVVVIGACAFWCLGGLRRSQEHQAMVCSGVILASLTASLAHSLVDFNWYCPACTVIVTLLAACACRLWQLSKQPSVAVERLSSLSPRTSMVLVVGLMVLGSCVLYQRLGPVLGESYWFQVRLLDIASDTTLDTEDEPADPTPNPAPSQAATVSPWTVGSVVVPGPSPSVPGAPVGSPVAPSLVANTPPTFQSGLLSAPLNVQSSWQLKLRPLPPTGTNGAASSGLPMGALLTSPNSALAANPSGSATAPAPQPTLQMQPSEEEHQAALDSKSLNDLQEVLRWQPDHAQAHLRIAAIHLRQFHRLQQSSPNAMPLAQIREAAFAARNAAVNPLNSRAALDAWMQRAFGEHCQFLDQALQHAHQALAIDPLLGEGYVYLSELCFLEGGDAEAKRAYLQQALLLQPYDPTVLFSVGTDAWLAGDLEHGGKYLRASFHAGKLHQEAIINCLAAGQASPADRQAAIQAFLEFFQPDYEAMRLLDRHYAQIAPPEELVTFHQHFARVAEAEATSAEARPARAAQIWLTAHRLYDGLGDYQRAHLCAQRAMGASPNNFPVRHQLGRFYLKMREFDEAKRHFEWCLSRKPHNSGLERDLLETERQRLLRDNPAAGIPQGFQR